MISIRRKLMAKTQSGGLDTSPRIAEYGKYLNRSTTGTAINEGWCYTDWYDINPIKEFITIKDNVTDIIHTFQYVMQNGTRDYWYGPTRPLSGSPYTIRFSIQITNIPTCYAYSETTGQIFFAGRNTPYYGYTNIHDMPTGT